MNNEFTLNGSTQSWTRHWVVRLLVLVVIVETATPLMYGMFMVSELLHPWDPYHLSGIMCALIGLTALGSMILLEHRHIGGHSTMASGLIPTSQSPRLFVGGVLWATVMIAAVGLVAVALGARLVESQLSLGRYSLAFSIALSTGEELVFRAGMLSIVSERFGSVTGVIVTSLVFGLIHLGNPDAGLLSTLNTVLIGLAFGVTTVRSGSIWTAVGCHATWNLLVALFFGTVSGFAGSEMGLSWFTLVTDESSLTTTLFPGAYGIEASPLATLVIIISFPFLRHISRPDPYIMAARYRDAFSTRHSPVTIPHSITQS
jgi:membrane protease YdiL (CAAX protease family)